MKAWMASGEALRRQTGARSVLRVVVALPAPPPAQGMRLASSRGQTAPQPRVASGELR